MSNINQILCFGEVLWDNLPTGALPGGAPMNVALHLTRFGLQAMVASSIGSDNKGNELLDFLKHSGLNTTLIQRHNLLPTSEVKVYLDGKNNASFEICEPVAWDDIQLVPSLETEAARSKAIVYGSLASRNMPTRQALLRLLESKILKIMDVNLRKPFDTPDIVVPLLEKADIVKLNDAELLIISGWYGLSGSFDEKMKKLYSHLNINTLIVTKGENGADVLYNDQLYSHPGFKVEVADTVGAGDAFLAGFLAAIFENKTLQNALEEASAIGAYVASQHGATPDYSKEIISKITRK